jgi:phage minor structural protein
MSNFMIEVYDKSFKKLCILDKAFDVNYTQEMNKLHTMEFTLLLNDEKNAYCEPFNYIKLYESGNNAKLAYIDMFCIMPMTIEKNASTESISYSCEHVLGKLLNTAIFQYFEIGGIGISTGSVIRSLLSRQNDWVLDKCDFSRQFQYSWENDNLLNAIFSIPNPFDEEYIFTWTTDTYPWKLNLIKPSNDVQSIIRYGRNLIGITKTEDASAICTRLYALGYGEGVNQLDITSVNPTKLPYIDADTKNKYGIIAKIWTDLRYQLPENLYAAAMSKLSHIKNPKVTYSIETVEFWAQTGIKTDRLNVGDVVRIVDGGSTSDVRIVKKSKSNIENDYLSCVIDISNEWESVSGLSDLYERTKIQETYAQGATNITPYNFHQNCDTSYPAKLRFKIPIEAVYINKVELSFQVSSFQAYSKAIAGGGGRTDTTESNGGQTSNSSSTNTTSFKQADAPTSSVEWARYPTTEYASLHVETTHTSDQVERDRNYITWTMSALGAVDIDGHTYYVSISNPEGYVWTTVWHEHSIDIPQHKHDFVIPEHSHTVFIEGHAHNMEHTHWIEGHRHAIILPNHIHEIQYGIYEGGRANEFNIKVDGKPLPIISACDDYDIIPYLKTTGTGGKIDRGWHEITFTPNDMCMLDVQLNVQTFINSRGGGNF